MVAGRHPDRVPFGPRRLLAAVHRRYGWKKRPSGLHRRCALRVRLLRRASRSLEPLAVYERYTEEGRRVIEWADEEAKGLRHTQVGTHHFLIALVRIGAFPGDPKEARLAVREATFEL